MTEQEKNGRLFAALWPDRELEESKVQRRTRLQYKKATPGSALEYVWVNIPDLYGDGNAMLELIAEMNRRGWQVFSASQKEEGGWRVMLYNPKKSLRTRTVQGEADTLEATVAEAALKALEKEK